MMRRRKVRCAKEQWRVAKEVRNVRVQVTTHFFTYQWSVHVQVQAQSGCTGAERMYCVV